MTTKNPEADIKWQKRQKKWQRIFEKWTYCFAAALLRHPDHFQDRQNFPGNLPLWWKKGCASRFRTGGRGAVT